MIVPPMRSRNFLAFQSKQLMNRHELCPKYICQILIFHNFFLKLAMGICVAVMLMQKRGILKSSKSTSRGRVATSPLICTANMYKAHRDMSA